MRYAGSTESMHPKCPCEKRGLVKGPVADLLPVLALMTGFHAGELRAQFNGLARRARRRDDDHAPFGRPAGIAFAGRCAGYLDHAAPFLCWCVACGPGFHGNKPPAAQSTRRAEGQKAGQGLGPVVVRRSHASLARPTAVTHCSTALLR
jgi:hypothetical protein